MIRSLAAHIPCSKSVLVALIFSVAGGAYAQESPLTEQDKALIEKGKQIAQKAQKMEMPSLLQNQHMDEAQAEAKAFSSSSKLLTQRSRRCTGNRLKRVSTLTIGYWFRLVVSWRTGVR